MPAKPKPLAEWPADQVERLPTGGLLPYARNSRTHSDEQVDQIAASIREWGFTNPVIVDEAGMIIAGHARVMAAKRLNLPEVPCVVAKGWSDAKKRAYVITDNKLALNSGWSIDILKGEIEALEQDNFELPLIGFSAAELAGLFPDDVTEGGAGSASSVPESSYREQYGVIVVCGSEEEQQEVFERLTGEGLSVRVVTT